MSDKKVSSQIKQILILSLPIIIENILQSLLGTVDTYFAGQIHDNAIAAIGVTNLIINIYISFFTALSVGASAVLARYVGQNDLEKANNSARQTILMGLYVGIIIGAISGLFYSPILKLSGAKPEVLGYAVPYFLIVAVPAVLLCLSLILSACLRASKDTKTPMYTTLFSNVLNIVLNFVFMKLGFGIVGLALATTISRIFVVVLLSVKLLLKKEGIHLHFQKIRLDIEAMKTILRIGLPAGLEKFIMRLGQLVYAGMIISIGTNSYVAHNIAGTIENYAYIPAFGFSMATAIMVGISMGESNLEKAKKMTWLTNKITTVCMIVFGVVFFVFAPQLAKLFSDTPEVQQMVVSVLRLIAFFQPAASLTQIITGALQGAGDTKFPMYTTFVGIWGFRICIGYLLAVVFKMGLFGVWVAYSMDITMRAIALCIRFNRGKWKKIDI